ncbi:72 kDa type IV collagenase-like [Leptidea sinapis]|uniref:72 kDa type IV collagenase-like n=1 Tax=Leptidea sinapis TaxID=189913 RepID=UPI0021C3E0CA|nr:72 kDa type IV collagenase-like [Leptidea sinapis]
MKTPHSMVFIILFYFCQPGWSLQLSSDNRKYVKYLTNFGYLSRRSLSYSNGITYVDDNSLKNSLERFQRYTRISTTGMLDDSTKNMMKLNRCVDPDVSRRRSKRFVKIGNWRKKHITYKITQYSSNLSKREVDSLIFLAFSVWAEHGDFTFTNRPNGRSDIEIRFENIEPQDESRITFGNAKNQRRASIITLNDAVSWSQDYRTGEPNLFQTAAHEIGHILGLGHTDVTGAMMYPIYDLGQKLFSLHDDDIQGIKDIYDNLDVVQSYPGRFKYKKDRNKIVTTFNNFRETITDAIQRNFGETPEIDELDIPEEFMDSFK